MTLHIVLFEPEIPQNTGNIARTCACTRAHLDLVEPMGFHLTAKTLARAAMSYWNDVSLTRWSCTQEFLEAHKDADLHFFTGNAHHVYTDASYADETFLVFGRESRGIDPQILEAHRKQCLRIPMAPGEDSLNVSNAAAITAYEVMRRRGFEGLMSDSIEGL